MANRLDNIIMGTSIFTFGVFPLLLVAGFGSYQIHSFNKSYNQAVAKDSDRDGNGNISDEEREYFRNEIYPQILLENKATIIDGEERYDQFHGPIVSPSKLAEWLDNYNSKESN